MSAARSLVFPVARQRNQVMAEAKIRERFRKLKGNLTERARRLFAASEAVAFGHGGIAVVMRATRMSRCTIVAGIRELNAVESGTATPMDPM
jgi:hypothetical protein